MFLRLIEEKEKNIVMIPINHLYIKETESGTKITKYINKTSEINSIEFVSSLNTFIWFKVSFVSMSVANNFIKTIEHIMGIKDIRKQYDFGEVIGKGGGFVKVKKLQDKKKKKIFAVKIIDKFYSSHQCIKDNDDMENIKFLVSEVDVCQILLRIKKPPSIVNF